MTPARKEIAQGFREVAGAVPNLARLLYRVVRDPRVPPRHRVVAGAIGVYLVSPLDAIPDWFPGIGQVDDMILVALALDLLLNRVPEEVLAEHWAGNPDHLAAARKLLATVTGMVPDRIKGWLAPE